ncbi:MAG: hypothetical protein IJC99_00600 [Clostridia bacterium]|nr:hypothetical protein [Clostridia bacterium]
MKCVKSGFLAFLALLLALLMLVSCAGPAGEQGLQGIQGEKGDPGSVVTIGDDGYWYIDGVKTNVKAAGAAGASGSVVTIGDDGYWYIDGVKTNVKAAGAAGASGSVVTIGDDGYWYIDGVKTNVKAEGAAGAPGSVVTIGDDGYWYIDGVCTNVYAGKPANDDTFVPVIRFVVGSDFHVRANANSDYGSRAMVTSYIQSAYAYSEAQTNYKGLDGIFFVGDITQGGADKEFEDFFSIVNQYTKTGTIARAVLGNHEFYATSYDDGTNSDKRYSDTSVKNTYERFKEYGGYEAVDAHLEIGGYHFIFLSMDRYDKSQNNFFTDAKLEWLDNELTAAAYDDPTGKKPIFVFQHEPPKDTMYGSVAGSSDADLTKVLSRYPQVVDFSGHTHYPVTDPRAIWQGTFTALTTGGMAYLGIPIAGHPTKDEDLVVATDALGSWTTSGDLEGYIRNATMYYVVEVDENDTVRISVCDATTGEVWGEPMIFTVGDPDEFIYTKERGNTALKPIWQEDAEAEVVNNFYKKTQIAIPQATCPSLVQNYRTDVYDAEGTLVKSVYTLACTYYGANTPEAVYAAVTGLSPDTTYTCKIYAVNSWGRASAPLTMTLTTSDKPAATANPTPDILQTVFHADGTATNAVTGEVLTVWGAPVAEYNSTIGRQTAIFDGVDDAYGMYGMDYWYDIIGKSFTIETYVYLSVKPSSSYVNIMSNQQSGGFGFEYKADGKMHLMANVGESATNRPQPAVTAGQWYHFVGTYDGATLKMYVNGELVGSTACTGIMKRPAAGSEYMVIGGDSAPGAPGCFAKCTIAAANLYSDPLTAEQIATLYAAYN